MNYNYYVVTPCVKTVATAVVPEIAPFDKTSSSILDFFYAF